jgi:putative protease
MNKTIELLAPGGDIDSIKAAIIAGANAVYCGLDKFNARNRATNITFDDLNGILRLAHQNNCQVFLTLNIIVVDSEIPALFSLFNKLINTSIDGIIIQDLGLFHLLSSHYNGFKLHASTQLTTHNEGQIKFLGELNATRVNLSRELNIREIKDLSGVAHKNNILTEVFVHGSYCISFSGICYISSVQSGNSGNRGRCSQPCRDQYLTTPAGKSFPLNLKDNSAFLNVNELAEAGVDSLKIEGRIKKFHYVYTVVDAWRKQLQNLYTRNKLNNDNSALYKVFNRDFSNGFLMGNINSTMFIDNPRDHSALHLSETNGHSTPEKLEKAKGDVYVERTDMIKTIENKINQLSISKSPLKIRVSGNSGTPLKISIRTPDSIFEMASECNLSKSGNEAISHEMLLKRLKSVNETEYFIEELELENLQADVYIPFKELTSLKKRLLYILNGSKDYFNPISVPTLKKNYKKDTQTSLSILISSKQEIYQYSETNATIHFQLPSSLKNEYQKYVTLLTENRKLVPWFPSILIGDDYQAALKILASVKPACIVTNNTGIAFEAYKKGIKWIAGPYLNIVNSYSLLCLKENFNCSGAFISNEISRMQIKSIKKPDDFELYYIIYHPFLLMTSWQFLFHMVTG